MDSTVQKSSDFWPTIKPFLSKKCKTGSNTIILTENDNVINKTEEVCNIFNEHYVNVANEIGKGITFNEDRHSSISAIKENVPRDSHFEFEPTNMAQIDKIIKNIGIKKATGVDQMSARLLKASTPVTTHHICHLVNQSISSSIFPDRLKEAQVIPLFKKEDPLSKKNYRPVSILPMVSKVYEKVLSSQLSDYFDNIFHTFYARSGKVMDARPLYYDCWKIGNKLWTKITMWQLFSWIFRKLLIACHMTFYWVNCQPTGYHLNL